MKPAFVAIVVALLVPHASWAQTPAQMEYERQQREARQAQERQQQEQQRQQQIQQENARRQQEEMNRLNRPTPSPPTSGQTPSYPTPSSGSQTPRSPTSPPTPQQQQPEARGIFKPPEAPQWVRLASTADGDVYGDVSTRVRVGMIASTWAMRDFKTAQQTSDGVRYLSTREKIAYNCDDKKMIIWLVTTFSGRMGQGNIVSSVKSSGWQPVRPNYEALLKFACAAKPTTL